jgi:hypothetical protein
MSFLLHNIDGVVRHAPSLLGHDAGDVVAVEVGIVKDEELEVAPLGVLKEGAHGFGRLTLTRTDCHVVALAELRRPELGQLALLLYVEDLIEGVLGELVGRDLTGA